jgi:hypothetical protein
MIAHTSGISNHHHNTNSRRMAMAETWLIERSQMTSRSGQ